MNMAEPPKKMRHKSASTLATGTSHSRQDKRQDEELPVEDEAPRRHLGDPEYFIFRRPSRPGYGRAGQAAQRHARKQKARLQRDRDKSKTAPEEDVAPRFVPPPPELRGPGSSSPEHDPTTMDNQLQRDQHSLPVDGGHGDAAAVATGTSGSTSGQVQQASDLDAKPTPQTTCPICGEPVDKHFLASFQASKGQRMRVREQMAFCQAHREREARHLCQARGWPVDIDWSAVRLRAGQNREFLSSLVRGGHGQTPAGAQYARDVRSGQNRTLFKEVMGGSSSSSSPRRLGYYGPQGVAALTECVVEMLGSELREQSHKDHLVSVRGVVSFVRAVLVPELGVKLVQEDLGIDEAKAREVLHESARAGDLLQS